MVRLMSARAAQLDQLPHARQQLGEHALALRVLVAREQRRQLDRDAVARRLPGAMSRAPPCAARRSRSIALAYDAEIAQRVALGARAFAQHVEAESAAAAGSCALRGGLVQRLADRGGRARTGGRAAGSPARWPRPPSARPGARAGRAARRRRAGSFLDSAIALADRLGQQSCAVTAVAVASKSAAAQAGRLSARWPSRRRARAAAPRPGASAPGLRRWRSGIRAAATPCAQNGAGLSRTACTQGAACAAAAGQSSRPDSDLQQLGHDGGFFAIRRRQSGVHRAMARGGTSIVRPRSDAPRIRVGCALKPAMPGGWSERVGKVFPTAAAPLDGVISGTRIALGA